jgi:hypothetical protein
MCLEVSIISTNSHVTFLHTAVHHLVLLLWSCLVIIFIMSGYTPPEGTGGLPVGAGGKLSELQDVACQIIVRKDITVSGWNFIEMIVTILQTFN